MYALISTDTAAMSSADTVWPPEIATLSDGKGNLVWLDLVSPLSDLTTSRCLSQLLYQSSVYARLTGAAGRDCTRCVDDCTFALSEKGTVRARVGALGVKELMEEVAGRIGSLFARLKIHVHATVQTRTDLPTKTGTGGRHI